MMVIKTKYWMKSADRASGSAGAIRESSMDELAPGLSLQGLHKISKSRGHSEDEGENITEKTSRNTVHVKPWRHEK